MATSSPRMVITSRSLTSMCWRLVLHGVALAGLVATSFLCGRIRSESPPPLWAMAIGACVFSVSAITAMLVRDL